MPRLQPHECYRDCGPVELGPVLPLLAGLRFVRVNQGGTDTRRYPCAVVLADKFPPELSALVAGLGLGGETARAILRRLDPGQDIPPHVDDWMPAESDWRRFQVPLVTHPAVVMRWPDDGQGLHLAAGRLYEVRYDRTHEVVNAAGVERIHLQVDQVGATV